MNAQTATAKAAAASPALILLREDKGGIAILTLNRPQARNSLSEAMLEALGDALTAIAHERTVRVVVLAANGPAFSAGHDLKELNAHRSDDDRGRAYFKHIMGLCSGVMQQIVTLPQPVIAAVQATATAAGCQLVASCDLAVASHGGEIRDARRQYRPVLLDADGGVVAQRFAQSRDGNAAHRRIDLGRGRRSASVSSIAWSRPGTSAPKRSSSRKRSPPNRR